MSDSEDSIVTYTAAPPSPNYVPGLEEPEQAPLLLEFVPEPIYLEFMPLEEEVFPAEEQPLPAAVSPTTDLPGYTTNSNLEEDPGEDPKEDPTDYPADEGDDDDDDDESSMRMMISILAQTPVPFLSEEEAKRFLAIPTPPPSPLTPLSSPLLQIPSSPLLALLPLPVSSPPPPASLTYPLGFRAAMIRLRSELLSTSHSPPPIILSHTRAPMAMTRAAAPSTYTLAPRSKTLPLLPISLPTPLPPFLLPSTNRRTDMPEDEMLVGMPGALATDDTELGRRMTKFATMRGGRSMAASDVARYEVMALRTTVLGQQADIIALRAVDCAQQAQLLETLRLMSTLQNEGDACKTSGPNKGSQHISEKMAPKRATSSTPATTTTTTSVINDQLKALIDQGVANALSACDADKSINGDDSHTQARV
ncbi:hypothetical protein Tco_0818831 [Tanacetum coccineum]